MKSMENRMIENERLFIGIMCMFGALLVSCIGIVIWLSLSINEGATKLEEYKELKIQNEYKLDSLDALYGASNVLIEKLEYEIDSLMDLSAFLGNTVIAFYAEADVREKERQRLKQLNKTKLNEIHEILNDTSDISMLQRDSLRNSLFRN